MDVVYPYISPKDQGELEYSIKSLKNLDHGRVIVVGDMPQFESEAEHTKPPIVRWSMLSPHHDVVSKLNFACSLEITEDFIVMNDDFFVMHPTNIPIAHRGTLDDHVKSRRLNDSYTKSLRKTNDYLKSRGIDKPLSYELHIPIVYNKSKLVSMFGDLIPMYEYDSVMLTRSLYGNLYNIGGEYMRDPKNISDYEGATFLSTNEKTFTEDIGKYIRTML